MTETESNIYESMSAETYHSIKTHAGSSSLVQMEHSPAHVKSAMEGEFKATPSMREGTLIHTAVVEFDLFKQQVIMGPDCDKRTREWKDFVAGNPGKTVLSPDAYERVLRISENVHQHPRVGPLFSRGKAEMSFFAVDAETGVAIKARPDFLTPGFEHYAELKSCEDARREAFREAIYRYNYHIRVAMTVDIVRQLSRVTPEPILIAVEKSPPYAVVPYVLEPDETYGICPLEVGERKYREYLKRLAECQKTGHWPAYTEDFEPISLPARVNEKESNL